MEPALWRIGELSRRVALSTQVLRAWERRYGLFTPQRNAAGYRLYSMEDERRARRVLALKEHGHSTAEAAQLVLSHAEPDAVEVPAPPHAAIALTSAPLSELKLTTDRLLQSLLAADEPATQETLDTLFALVDLETAIVGVILPVLKDLGDAWAQGKITVAAEHYASSLLHSRLTALARGWDTGSGPRAVLACAPREEHCIGLLAFGLALRRRGWRIAYLGPNTPVDTLTQWVLTHPAAAIVISTVTSERLDAVETELADLARHTRIALGGAGADSTLAKRIGAILLAPDPSTAADQLSTITTAAPANSSQDP